eukprot:scaffold9776_cov126-Isochrysis_galbana.AAC.3
MAARPLRRHDWGRQGRWRAVVRLGDRAPETGAAWAGVERTAGILRRARHAPLSRPRRARAARATSPPRAARGRRSAGAPSREPGRTSHRREPTHRPRQCV